MTGAALKSIKKEKLEDDVDNVNLLTLNVFSLATSRKESRSYFVDLKRRKLRFLVYTPY